MDRTRLGDVTMTLAKAKQMAGAIVDAGYEAKIIPVKNAQGSITDWQVTARTTDAGIPVNTVKTAQDALSVTATVRDVLFV